MRILRDLNRIRIVDELHRRGSASRSDLARWTGLSRSTVAAVVADLHSRGVMLESLEGDHEAPGRGRPPVLLSLNPSAAAALVGAEAAPGLSS